MSRSLVWLVTGMVGLGVLVGCGGSSSSSSQSATGTTKSSTSKAPLSKDDYENQGVAALQPAELAQKAATAHSDANTWGQVGAGYQKAHDDFQAFMPPASVADLHQQIVSVLGASAQAANKISGAFNSGGVGGSAGQAAVSDFRTQAQNLVGLGQQFKARGYTKLGS